MNDNMHDIYQQANSLMQDAIKEFIAGNYADGETKRKKANELYDTAENYANMEMSKDAMLYGEGRNFGIIYSVVEANAPKWFLSKKHGKALKELKEAISKDVILKNEFMIYDACNSLKEGVDEKAYVSELFKSIPTYSPKQIKESNEKLLRILRKHHADEMIVINDDKAKLYESIEYLLTHRRNVRNISECLSKQNNICRYLLEHIQKDEEDNHEVDVNMKINEMSNFIMNEMNESEKHLIDEIAKYNNVGDAFEGIREDVRKKINKAIDESNDTEKERWRTVLKSVNEMKFDGSQYEDLVKLYTIKEKL